ncbi:DUF6064 family protein [Bradyrhizobium sp. 1050_B9_N1_2]|uniref:DUF6064 family protein n=1 Tax=Bradyrhizobium sp. 1050_B9_N1_2 TaxID=3238688 RepID=UPI003EDBDDAF
MLPFSLEQFLAVFASYNAAIWPAQIGAYFLGGLAIVLVLWKPPHADRITTGILAMMWLWTGLVYLGAFFSTINKAAYFFCTLFVIQAAYLLYSGVYHNRLRFGFAPGTMAWVGVTLVIYSGILYPLIGMAIGHPYPEMPMFGVTPCPVTIFTFGLLLLTVCPVPRALLVVPSIWSLIGGSAAVLLNVQQDWLLLVSALVVVPLIGLRDRQTLPNVQAI